VIVPYTNLGFQKVENGPKGTVRTEVCDFLVKNDGNCELWNMDMVHQEMRLVSLAG